MDLDRVDESLRVLESADTGARAGWRGTFGAHGRFGHGYKRRPVSDAQIRALEQQIGVAVPEELRLLWRRIGAGVGPSYGLFDPVQVADELADWAQVAAEGGTVLAVAEPFPLVPPGAEDSLIQMTEGPLPGVLPLTMNGAPFWSTIVVAGPQAGRIWELARFYVGTFEWAPGLHRTGAPVDPAARGPAPTLSEWYEGWIEQSLGAIPPAPDPDPRPWYRALFR